MFFLFTGSSNTMILFLRRTLVLQKQKSAKRERLSFIANALRVFGLADFRTKSTSE